MSRINRMNTPAEEIMMELYQARTAIATQKARVLKCPYCGRSVLIVFEDTGGHIQTKCKSCGQEVVFTVRRENLYFS